MAPPPGNVSYCRSYRSLSFGIYLPRKIYRSPGLGRWSYLSQICTFFVAFQGQNWRFFFFNDYPHNLYTRDVGFRAMSPGGWLFVFQSKEFVHCHSCNTNDILCLNTGKVFVWILFIIVLKSVENVLVIRDSAVYIAGRPGGSCG